MFDMFLKWAAYALLAITALIVLDALQVSPKHAFETLLGNSTKILLALFVIRAVNLQIRVDELESKYESTEPIATPVFRRKSRKGNPFIGG